MSAKTGYLVASRLKLIRIQEEAHRMSLCKEWTLQSDWIEVFEIKQPELPPQD